MRRTASDSVPRQGLVDPIRPAIDTAGEVADLFEAVLEQEGDGVAAAASGAAVDDDLVVFGELLEILRERAERNLDGIAEVRDRPLSRLADVHQNELLAAIA